MGRLPPELTFGDVDAAGKAGVVQRRRNQVPFLHILRSGDNLDRLFSSHIHPADPHMIRVGMPDHGQNPAHHHVLNLRIQTRIGLHLLTGQSHGLHKFPVGNLGQVHKFFVDPFSVEFHFRPPP